MSGSVYIEKGVEEDDVAGDNEGVVLKVDMMG
jgi:hypothetical protein